MTRLCLPHLRDGGHIVNLGSIAGRQAYENAALYVTSKFAVRGFTYALREDLLGRPVRITTVDPGLVETDFSLVRFRGDAQKARAGYGGVEAMRPDDVAESIPFALSRPPHVSVVENEGMEPASVVLALEFGNDFADISSVKDHDFAPGDPLRAEPLPPVVGGRYNGEGNVFLLEDPENSAIQTQVVLSQPGAA